MQGLLDYFYFNGWAESAPTQTPQHDITSGGVVEALRRADLLAAMCQETIGDHSQVTRSQLSHVESGESSVGPCWAYVGRTLAVRSPCARRVAWLPQPSTDHA